ncbi:calponin homology domain-containing protein DDB_G0272472-like [Plectropomus leopardus]|uniref:calponin homology domain-containing protein DDB_G0272472-like n=1 Tax=Plectropomus leopardus TaxID=160734 RepID=UPI001C4AF8DF|nr:calponin homology domain-containing protein DDB_G0272472-like [Plectropomus leopardus]
MSSEGKTPSVESKNGKRTERGAGGDAAAAAGGGGSKYSMFTWIVVLALLGVWSSVAVVYFDIVDYDSVIGKLTAYDTDGDGDFDVEDAKVLLDEKKLKAPALRRDRLRKEDRKEVKKKRKNSTLNPNLRPSRQRRHAALRSQVRALRMIHEKMEAKRIARIAVAEIRAFLAEEEEEKEKAWELKMKTLEVAQEQLRAEKEKAEKERMEREKAEKERMEREAREKERLARERAERERQETERLAKEKAAEEERKRLEREKAEMEKQRERGLKERELKRRGWRGSASKEKEKK